MWSHLWSMSQSNSVPDHNEPEFQCTCQAGMSPYVCQLCHHLDLPPYVIPDQPAMMQALNLSFKHGMHCTGAVPKCWVLPFCVQVPAAVHSALLRSSIVPCVHQGLGWYDCCILYFLYIQYTVACIHKCLDIKNTI